MLFDQAVNKFCLKSRFFYADNDDDDDDDDDDLCLTPHPTPPDKHHRIPQNAEMMKHATGQTRCRRVSRPTVNFE